MGEMKKLWIPILIGLGLLSLGAVTVGDQFVVRLLEWTGLSKGENFSMSSFSPAELCNFEINRDGDQTYLVQRPGTHVITPIYTRDVLGLYATTISQINGDSERVVIVDSKGKIQTCSGVSSGTKGNWFTVLGLGGESTYVAVQGSPYCSILQFKDTILVTGGLDMNSSVPPQDSIFMLAMNSGKLKKVKSYVWHHGKILLHQDRIYGFGTVWSRIVDPSWTNLNYVKLTWMPEFDTRFDRVDTVLNGGFVYIGRNDGDYLTNVVPLGSNLIAYKTHSIWNVYVDPGTNAPSEVVKITDNVGAMSYDAVCSYNGIHYFISSDGVYSNDGTNVKRLSQPIDFWFRDSIAILSPGARGYVLQAVQNRLYVSLPVRSPSSKTTINGARIFVYDMITNNWWKMIPTGFNGSGMFLLRYNFSPLASPGFANENGGPYHTPRLFIIGDSTTARVRLVVFPAENFRSDDGQKFTSVYTTSLNGFGEMWSRKQLDRATVFGSGVAACTAKVDWYGDANTIIDSSKFALTSTPKAVTKRLPPTISGQMLKFRLRVDDTLALKINALEIVGFQKGLANDQ